MTWRWQRAITAVAVAATLLGCTDSEPIDRPTTSIGTVPPTTVPTFDMTDFSMEQVANAAPLEWTRAISDDSLQPAGLVNVGGTSFVFAEGSSGQGLWGWSSDDGVTWAELGEILADDVAVAAVSSSEDSIFLVTEGRAAQNPQVWSSRDGLDWTVEDIPAKPDQDPLAFIPEALLATSDVRIVTGRWIVDTQSLLEQAVRDTLWPGFDAREYGLEVRPTTDTIEIDVLGPFQLTLFTTTTDDLGLDPSVQEMLRSEPDSPGTTTWVSYQGDWTSGTIEGAEIVSSMAITQDGAVVAAGWTQLGLVSLWNSFDGVIWEQIPYDSRPYLFESWGDRLAGPGAVGDFDLLVSDDGVDWMGTGLGRSFPRTLVWHVTSMSASDRGMAFTVEAWESENLQGEIPLPIPVEKGDVEIFVNPSLGGFVVFEANTDAPYLLQGGPHDDSFVFDPAAETVRLLRPDGSDLVELTLDEIDSAAESFADDTAIGDRYHRGLVLTNDANSWSIWDLAPLGPVAEPGDVGMAEDNLVVSTRDHARGTGFELWTAQLP